MSRIFNFNIQTLDSILDADGIEKTWKRILVTHLQSKPNFKYIVEEPEFKSCKALSNDLIEGLSIGEIGVLYEYSLTHGSISSRKTNG